MATAHPTHRFKLTVAYRGTAYHGWQQQGVYDNYTGSPPVAGRGIPTIQETLSLAMREVLGHAVELRGSSRTDSGVHAKGQVAHFDTPRTEIPTHGMMRAINARLPGDILVRQIRRVGPAFNAISDTLTKRYQYSIWNAPERPVFFADLAFHRWQSLDVDAMTRAAGMLAGTHDFASFAKPGHGRQSTVRTIHECSLCQRGQRIVLGVEGSGFLWNMVRIIAGTLVEIGLGRYKSDDVPGMLAAKDRQAAGATAPANGLYLHWIRYRPGAESEERVVEETNSDNVAHDSRPALNPTRPALMDHLSDERS